MKKNGKTDLIIFDMDGTLFTSNVDWAKVKKRLNVDGSTILEKLYNGNFPDTEGISYLEEIEEKNTRECKPFPGSLEFVNNIKSRGIPVSLVTNNSKKNAEYLLNKFGFEFDAIITREVNMWKPSPDAFRFLMEKFNADPRNTMSIGDSDFDVTASVKSGLSDVYIIRNSKIRGSYPIRVRLFTDYFELSSIIFMS